MDLPVEQATNNSISLYSNLQYLFFLDSYMVYLCFPRFFDISLLSVFVCLSGFKTQCSLYTKASLLKYLVASSIDRFFVTKNVSKQIAKNDIIWKGSYFRLMKGSGSKISFGINEALHCPWTHLEILEDMKF